MLLAPLLFGALAASISVSEEIEGRTAVTVMSKPINRRSFLLGKFFGVLMACAAMSTLLAANLNGALLANRAFDPIQRRPRPRCRTHVRPGEGRHQVDGIGRLVRGHRADCSGQWRSPVAGRERHPARGVLLGFGQVMILVAVATALATRLHFVVSLVSVLLVYAFGHLAPVVAQVTSNYKGQNAGAALVGIPGKRVQRLTCRPWSTSNSARRSSAIPRSISHRSSATHSPYSVTRAFTPRSS